MKKGVFTLLLVSLCIITSCSDNSGLQNLLKPQKGVLDLSEWDFKKDGVIKLDGEWEFYWRKLLNSKDFIKSKTIKKSGYITVPSSWNSFKVNGKEIGSYGYATYRLKIILPKFKNNLALRFLDMRTSFKAYINGRLIAQNGVVGKTFELSKPQYLPLVSGFNAGNSIIELIVQISNFHCKDGGFWHSICFGEIGELRDERERNLVFQIFLFGSILIMGLYLLGMFFIQKAEKSPLYLGVFCLLIALRPLITGEYYIVHNFPWINWELILKLEYISLYAGLPIFTTFIYSLFPKDFPRLILRFIQINGLIFTMIVIVTTSRIYSYTIIVYEVFTLLAGVYICYIVVISSIRKREGANIFLFGTFVMLITVTNEILYDNMIFDTGNFFPFGLFVFVLSQAFLVSLRFSKAHERNKKLSLIEQELKLAERIQLSTLPMSSPQLSGIDFSVMYIPSADVGGDFYDFYQIDEKKIGFLLADVSGHGIPAAMIASMIKVIFLMLKHLAEKPIELMKEMNRILSDNIQKHFATAVYIYIDLERKTVYYVRCGHEPLLVYRRKDKRMEVYKPKGYLIGAFKDIKCELLEFEIHKGDRLILYTDGITELFDKKRELFGLASFKESIIEKSNSNQNELIKHMQQVLHNWAGDVESFNDDVTMLLIDIA